jgi:TRAP-type transport system periplasmic protein
MSGSMPKLKLLAGPTALLFFAAGCNGVDDDPTDTDDDVEETEDTEEAEEAEEAEDVEEVSLDFAHVYEASAPTHACGADLLPEALEEADIGVTAEIFPNAQLGSESELVEQIASDELDMAIAGPSFLATLDERVGLFDAAYAFEDEDQLMEVAQGDLGQELFGDLEESAGVVVLNTWYYGARHVTSNEPVSSPDDLAGMRLRMPDSAVMLASGEAIGAQPTAVEFEEVYTSLQQGVIDAQENPIPTISAMGFHEVQDYLNLTGHIQSSTQNLMSQSAWDSLSEEQREGLLEVFEDLAEEVSQCIADGDEQLVEEWRETGEMEINEDIDADAFAEAATEFFSDGFEFSEDYQNVAEGNY